MSCFWNAITKKYGVFSGRARRREFWLFHLFYLLLFLMLGFLAVVISVIVGVVAGEQTYDSRWVEMFSGIWILALLVPTLAIAARRLHDIGQSGWLMLIALVPILNLALVVMFLIDGNPGDNRFGPDPKGRTVAKAALS